MYRWLNRIEKINIELKKGCYLFGAGTNGEWVLDYCNKLGIQVLGFIDTSKEKAGKLIKGIDTISYEEYLHQNEGGRVILISAKHCSREIMQMYPDNDLMIPFDTWYIVNRKQDYEQLQFNDELSYRTMSAIQSCMMEADRSKLYPIVDREQYFCIPPFFQSMNETFVDLGACTGDSIERFFFSHVGSYKHIYAFEPGETQIKALSKRICRLAEEWAVSPDSITVQQGVVGVKTGKRYLEKNAELMNMRVADENTGVEIDEIGLDDYFGNTDVSFIKADIEGAEYEMLLGAEQLIKRCVPKIAISVYHRPDDLIKIYNLLRSWIPEYHFALRHHASFLVDTVLYCWVD